MTRPKGSKNNKNTGINIPESAPKFISGDGKTKTIPPYIVVKSGDDVSLCVLVADLIFNGGYQCQGGVSVTSYPDGRGGMTFVYCQSMVRKE
jgi:hypothetical protein